MASIPDIQIPNNDFVSLNSLSGIAVGTSMEIQLKGVSPVVLWEDSVKPASDSDDGKVITNLQTSYAVVTVKAGSDEIWARSLKEGIYSKVHISVI